MILSRALPLPILGLCLPALAAPITEKNWMGHPQIKAVRGIFKEIQDGIKSGKWKAKKKAGLADAPYDDDEREIVRDSQGRARKYTRAGGSEDSALTRTFYYDQSGRLRFVFVTGGAVSGAELEHRIYYDRRGSRVWEVQKYVKGAYTFPRVWPEGDIVWDPDQAFVKSPSGDVIRDHPSERWRAVVAIIRDPSASSEDWGWFCDDIAQACQKAGNQFSSADAREPLAVIGPASYPWARLDMSDYIKRDGIGWVLITNQHGKKTFEFVDYDITNRDRAASFCRKK